MITIESSGHILVPETIRKQLGLLPDTKSNIQVQEGKLIIEPITQQPNIINEDGLLVVDASLSDDLKTIIDDFRSERIHKLSTI